MEQPLTCQRGLKLPSDPSLHLAVPQRRRPQSAVASSLRAGLLLVKGELLPGKGEQAPAEASAVAF